MDNQIIKVRDITVLPASRKIEDDASGYSGEKFRDDYLIPAFIQAVEGNYKLIVDLDGTIGYGTSWLEEVFGGLVRHMKNKELVKNLIQIKSDEEPYLIEDIQDYIDSALN